MKQELLNSQPEWLHKLMSNPKEHSKKLTLILTDDLDSYYSCMLLKNIGIKTICGFYDRNNGLYLMENAKKVYKNNRAIHVDSAICTGQYCIDNHMVHNELKNSNSCNPNNILSSECEYTDKYNGSTALFIYALLLHYGHIDKSTLDKDEITKLLCIDSAFLGYFKKKNGSYIYRETTKKWWDLLEMEELKDFCDNIEQEYKDDSIRYFENYIEKNGLKAKILINEDGILKTEYDNIFTDKLALPKGKYKLFFKVKAVNGETYNQVSTYLDCFKIISNARVRSRTYNYSYRIA